MALLTVDNNWHMLTLFDFKEINVCPLLEINPNYPNGLLLLRK